MLNLQAILVDSNSGGTINGKGLKGWLGREKKINGFGTELAHSIKTIC